ncbi:MAG TPA: ZIP family metal transporter [Blastocatellia bacterium]|nr:ZIP family metal transporter [Blastocatellia bacterium]
MEAILLAIGTFLSTLAGGLFGIRHRRHIHLIISFTAGVLVGIVFFDILPEVFHSVVENRGSVTASMGALIVGFLAIHILEKVAVIHSAHEKAYADHKHPLVGYIGALGLAVHSFLDGVGIGLGFHVSTRVGVLIAVAVIAHDFSDGLNTVSLMLINKNTVRKSLGILVLDAITPLLGLGATYLFSIPSPVLVIYLGFFAGFLLYIGAGDLLPEAHSTESSYAKIGLTVLGVLFIFIVTRLA